MITLDWHQVSDLRLHANHERWLFVIDRMPNWTKAAPAMVYDFYASGYEGGTRHALGTFTDSKAARAKCAEFINTQAGDSRG